MIKTQDRVIPYIQPEGRGTPLEPLSIDRHGLGDQTDNTIPGRGVLFGRDEFGRPVPKVEFDEPPSGLNTATVTFDPEADLDFLDTMRLENGKFGIWNFYIPTGRLGNYANWTNGGDMEFLAGCKISAGTKGGREKDYSGQPLANTYDLSWRNTLKILPPKLTDSSPTAAVTDQDINSVFFISDLDPNQEIPGYPGRDKIGFAACDADAAAIADVLYTVNGGGSWAAFAQQPFAADEHLGGIAARFKSADTYRLVVLKLTATAAEEPKVSYADIILGGEGGTITWTEGAMTGATVNTDGEALLWPLYGRLYTSADTGKIFVSQNQGQAFAQVADMGVVGAQFAMDYDMDIWVVGAADNIWREKNNNRGTFDQLVGPGGGDISAIAIGRDGYVYVGAGTKLYRSNNQAANVGGWTELQDYGTNHSVVGIQCIDGESQLIRIVVNDGTAFEGDVYYSLDGGNSQVEVTNLSNLGYNGFYASEVDPNLLFIAGEDDATNGVVHKLSF